MPAYFWSVQANKLFSLRKKEQNLFSLQSTCAIKVKKDECVFHC